ncbi:Phospholipid/glycerol acyltransferase [Cordyceps militaris CM01]|uniref:Phospholipid/glycerol acyltransferase n=1 Tax=Cordyceps militaris (strain CM01) TaxID=983644 RepID=G3JG70_CORMM|nr:Phospholipid/glycerol acyltransferase [Cordyceps militaris CM01]EGX92348.1 Phospholipid/glycerol acyltransferase [Cordyceps militaris CM01]
MTELNRGRAAPTTSEIEQPQHQTGPSFSPLATNTRPITKPWATPSVMEKYSQYRDRATGIAPFLPVTTTLSAVSAAYHALIFALRLPFFLFFAAGYFGLFQHLPLPVIARKVALWCLLGIPGIWWVDLQLDGVKRGTLADQPRRRFPHGGAVIAANWTSPVDVVYLAAVFDPVFTLAYPGTRRVRRVGLFAAVLAALALPADLAAPPDRDLVELRDLLRQYPDRPIAVFPECTTTNGKAILPLSPSLLACPPDVLVFPVSLRYTPADVTTPVPGRWAAFLWNLLSRPTTCIRVRIAEGQSNTSAASTNGASANAELRLRAGDAADVSAEEQRVLDTIAEALARLGRVKRVGLTVEDKSAFVKALHRKRS